MAQDPKILRHEDTIDDLKPSTPDWIKTRERPATPCVVPAFGPLEGVRDRNRHFGRTVIYRYEVGRTPAEAIHIERPDVFALWRRN
jgi:hypothetical protein